MDYRQINIDSIELYLGCPQNVTSRNSQSIYLFREIMIYDFAHLKRRKDSCTISPALKIFLFEKIIIRITGQFCQFFSLIHTQTSCRFIIYLLQQNYIWLFAFYHIRNVIHICGCCFTRYTIIGCTMFYVITHHDQVFFGFSVTTPTGITLRFIGFTTTHKNRTDTHHQYKHTFHHNHIL